MSRSRLIKRGASTQQNIFYLIIAAIIVASAAYGINLAFQTYNSTKTRDTIMLATENIRSQYYSLSTLDGIDTDTMIQMGLIPSFLVVEDEVDGEVVSRRIETPYSGDVQFGLANANQDFTFRVRWPQSSGKTRGICSVVGIDHVVGQRVASGNIGRDYTITNMDCDSPTPEFTVQYHRDR